jgi:hypothetical protein
VPVIMAGAMLATVLRHGRPRHQGEREGGGKEPHVGQSSQEDGL